MEETTLLKPPGEALLASCSLYVHVHVMTTATNPVYAMHITYSKSFEHIFVHVVVLTFIVVMFCT